MYKLIALVATVSLVLGGCYTDNEEDLYPSNACDTVNVTYQSTIKPIITGNCALSGCHGGSGAAASINLDTYDGLKAIAASGKLSGVINHQSGFSPMPKNGPKLSECYLNQINKWVAAGALNN